MPRRVLPTLPDLRRLLEQAVAVHGPRITLAQFEQHSGVNDTVLYRVAGSWTRLRRDAGLPGLRGRSVAPEVTDTELCEQWHRLVERLGRHPKMREWARYAPMGTGVIQNRGGKQAMLERYARWLTRRRYGLDQPAAPDEHAPADSHYLAERWRSLTPGFALHSAHARRDFDDADWRRIDFLIVLEHDWPACPRPVLELHRFRRPDRPHAVPHDGSIPSHADDDYRYRDEVTGDGTPR